MAELSWDLPGERVYETGVEKGVLYLPDEGGAYDTGFAWNGLTAVTESPSGAEATPLYADNTIYVNLVSTERFGATLEAYTYPDEFGQCNGEADLEPGISIGQQTRRTFGLSYKTLLGNDLEGVDFGYKLHLIYGCLAAPSEKAYATVNESPEAATLSWELSTVPVAVPGFKPTAQLTIDSTKVDADALADLEEFLYGTVGTDPSLPLPAAVAAIFSGTLVEATPTEPTFVTETNTITIPTVTGVVYKIDGEVVAAGAVVITEDTIVTAVPAEGYKFPVPTDDDWFYNYTP